MMTTATLASRPTAPAVQPSQDAAPDAELFPVKLRLPEAVIAAGLGACEDWFWDVCIANPDILWALELNDKGELELMPTYAYGERRDTATFFEIESWNRRNDSPGMTTGPTAAFFLSNGAIRSPDAAWTLNANVLPPSTEPPRTWSFCPDFVVEVRSDSQIPNAHLLAKMQEYMDNGAQLGWFIDPLERTVRIYRAGAAEPELLHDPETLDGENVLPGFTFAVRQLIFDLV